MSTIRIPYGESFLPLRTEGLNIAGVLNSKAGEYTISASEQYLVRSAIQNPIHSQKLSDLAVGKQKVVVITSDHTRSVPSKLTLPILLAEIRSGNPDADIEILIGTGLHRATTEAEQRSMFGNDIVDNEKIIVHDAFDPSQMVDLGELPSGCRLEVNRRAVECDLLVTEGFIEPHFFAGFSGGRKSILPGVSSERTVKENHSFKQLNDVHSITASLRENPINLDMEYAARKVNVQFTLSVALGEEKNVIAAFAGDVIDSHHVGCEFVRDLAKAEAITGDIVVTSNGGYPLDQNLYQCPKAIASAEVCAGESGTIIIAAECRNGMGGVFFEELMQSGNPPDVLERLARLPQEETIPEQWCVQRFCQTLLQHKIILVTDHIPEETIRRANLIPARSIEDALALALEDKGSHAKVVVIPDGVAVVPIKKKEGA